MKNKILLTTIIISFLFVPIIVVGTTNGILSNRQLINLLKELIFLLMKQIEMMQKQIDLQQQSIGQLQSDLIDLTTTTTTSSTTTTTTTTPPTTTTTTTTTTKPSGVINFPVIKPLQRCFGRFPCFPAVE